MNIQWDTINAELARDSLGEWLDKDAGWMHTPRLAMVWFSSGSGTF